MLYGLSQEQKFQAVTAKDKYGNTPLHDAAWGSNAEAVKLLIVNGADISVVEKPSNDMQVWDAAYKGINLAVQKSNNEEDVTLVEALLFPKYIYDKPVASSKISMKITDQLDVSNLQQEDVTKIKKYLEQSLKEYIQADGEDLTISQENLAKVRDTINNLNKHASKIEMQKFSSPKIGCAIS